MRNIFLFLYFFFKTFLFGRINAKKYLSLSNLCHCRFEHFLLKRKKKHKKVMSTTKRRKSLTRRNVSTKIKPLMFTIQWGGTIGDQKPLAILAVYAALAAQSLGS